MGPELKSTRDFKRITDHRWTPEPQSALDLQVDPELTKGHGLLKDPDLQVYPGSNLDSGLQVVLGSIGGPLTTGGFCKPQFTGELRSTGGPRPNR